MSSQKKHTDTELMQQKVHRVQKISDWIYGNTTTGENGLLVDIKELIESHASDTEALFKIKSVVPGCDVHEENTPLHKIYPTFNAFFHRHFAMLDFFADRNEGKMLEACQFLAKIRCSLKNAVVPGMHVDVSDAFTVRIKHLQNIVEMRGKEISHTLSDLKTPAISDSTDKLVTDGSDCVNDTRLLVDDEKEWAAISVSNPSP